MSVNGIYVIAHAKVIINDTIVHEVGINQNIVSIQTNNDANQIGSYCDILLPSNVRIAYNNNTNQSPTPGDPDPQIDVNQANNGYITAPTRYYFNTGDHIVIKAKYEGYENETGSDNDGYLPVFDGFIYDFYESTPIKIKCLDYIYWFNIGIYGSKIITVAKKNSKGKIPKKPKTASGIGVSYTKVAFKELIQDVIDTVNYNIAIWNGENGTSFPDVELSEPMFDMTLVDISFVQMSPAAVLEWFKKELGLNISLNGNKLYVNVASNTLSVVTFKTDVNVITSGLQTTNLQHTKTKGANSVFLRIKVKAYFIKENGTKDSFEIGDENGKLREVFFYNVKKGKDILVGGKTVPENYNTLAQEALQKFHQDRYTGDITAYLYPYCELFWKAQYYDMRYPERNGNYVVTSQSLTINENGFHRKLKLAYLDDQNG